MKICRPERDHGLALYRRFIDDGLGIQLQTPGRCARLLTDLNNFGPKGRQLEWTTSGPQTEVTFLDLTLTIRNGYVQAKTYQKPLNLHLYIPAHSAHLPSVAKSLIYGQIRRFWLQNTKQADFVDLTGKFFTHLKNRGYSTEFLETAFLQAAEKLQETSNYNKTKRNDNYEDRRVFLHVSQ